MPNLVAYNSGSPISNAIQFGTIVMDVNGDVPKGSLLWCPDFGICNQYIIITDSYTNGKTNQANSRPMGFKTPTLTTNDLIEAINKLAASKFAGPFLSLEEAINWAIYQGYFITNQEYPSIVTNGCVLNLDSNFPPSYPLVFDTWYDLTGNNNFGLLNNGVLYDGPLRGSLLFNGTNQYVSFSATTNIPVGNSDYTISAWFNPASLGTKGIVGWGNYGTTNAVNALRLSSSGIVNYWQSNDLSASYSFTTNNWYNAVATFDGTTRSIWVNGSLIGSDTPLGHNVPNSTNLTVGVTNTTEYFAGNMGEVQIFNRALSSTEITQNYNALLPRYNGTYTDPCNGAPQCTPTPTGTQVLTPSQTVTPTVTATQTYTPTITPMPTGTPFPTLPNYQRECTISLPACRASDPAFVNLYESNYDGYSNILNWLNIGNTQNNYPYNINSEIVIQKIYNNIGQDITIYNGSGNVELDLSYYTLTQGAQYFVLYDVYCKPCSCNSVAVLTNQVGQFSILFKGIGNPTSSPVNYSTSTGGQDACYPFNQSLFIYYDIAQTNVGLGAPLVVGSTIYLDSARTTTAPAGAYVMRNNNKYIVNSSGVVTSIETNVCTNPPTFSLKFSKPTFTFKVGTSVCTFNVGDSYIIYNPNCSSSQIRGTVQSKSGAPGDITLTLINWTAYCG
jgi:hypothetical protein